MLCTAWSLRWSQNKWERLQGKKLQPRLKIWLRAWCPNEEALCTVGPVSTQGRFCRAGWHLQLPPRVFLSRKGDTQEQSRRSYCKSFRLFSLSVEFFLKRGQQFADLCAFWFPLSSFYLRKGRAIIWTSMGEKYGVIYCNSTAFLGDFKLRWLNQMKGGKRHFLFLMI